MQCVWLSLSPSIKKAVSNTMCTKYNGYLRNGYRCYSLLGNRTLYSRFCRYKPTINNSFDNILYLNKFQKFSNNSDSNSSDHSIQTVGIIDEYSSIKKQNTDIRSKMINKLYDAHFEHNHKTKINVLLYYLEGKVDTEDILLGDLKTKRFFYDTVAHSMPQMERWQKEKNAALSVQLFKKFCKHDEDFRNSSLCLQMANDIFLRILKCFEHKDHKIHNFKTPDSWLRTIRILSKQDEKALVAFCQFFKFVKENNFFCDVHDIKPTEVNEKVQKNNGDVTLEAKGDEDSEKAMEMKRYYSEICKVAVYMHCYNGDFDQAKNVLREFMMREKCDEKTVTAFVRILLSQCTKDKRSISIEEVLEFVAEETSINNFDSSMYHQIFQACVKARKVNTAVKHIKTFRKKRVKPIYDGLYSLMIRSCRTKHNSLALVLYNEFKDVTDKKNNSALDDKVNVPTKIQFYAKSFAALLDCYRPLKNNEDITNFEMLTKIYEELHFNLHNSLTKALDFANNTSDSISDNNTTQKNIQACQESLSIMYVAYFKKCLEYEKYTKMIEIYNNELKDINHDKQNVARAVDPAMYTYVLRAIMLQKLSMGKKHFKRGLAFYMDEIRACRQQNLPLTSLDYHHIISAFQRDFLDKNSIHVANEADLIFKDALKDKVINIFPGIEGNWHSQKDDAIRMCDLHSISNRQTALVAAKYICTYFDKEKYGDSNKASFGIIVGRGRFQEENVYSKIICKYLDHEGIQYKTKNGIIYLNWPSVMKWRNA